MSPIELKRLHKITRSHDRSRDRETAFFTYLNETTESDESSSDEEFTEESVTEESVTEESVTEESVTEESVTEDCKFKTVKICKTFGAVFHCIRQTFAKVFQYWTKSVRAQEYDASLLFNKQYP